MRLLPASLAARTVLLVIAVVAVAEITTFSLFMHFRRDSHASQTVQFIAGQVRLLQSVMPGLDSAARRRIADADVGEAGLQLRPDGEGVPQHEPRFGFARRLAVDLGAQLGGGQQFGLFAITEQLLQNAEITVALGVNDQAAVGLAHQLRSPGRAADRCRPGHGLGLRVDRRWQ